MEIPEPKALDKEYLPPVADEVVNDIAVGDFAPYISARANIDDEITAEEITTIEPEEA